MGSDRKITVDDKTYTPGNFCHDIAKLKADAESYLGEKVEKAVITVPHIFQTLSVRLQGCGQDSGS